MEKHVVSSVEVINDNLDLAFGTLRRRTREEGFEKIWRTRRHIRACLRRREARRDAEYRKYKRQVAERMKWIYRFKDSALSVHAIGSKVWVHDDKEAWLKAEVIALDGEYVKVRTEFGDERREKGVDCPRQNLETRPEEDMTKLPYLNEPAVLWNLKARYKVDDIYTYTGSILIAINPFANLSHLYGKHMMEQYRGVELGELSPHVYAVADEAYRLMRKEQRSQSVLVSGESGAGKTETSKLLMRYLAFMGGFDQSEAPPGTRSVEQQILESNPLLETFGNAKTVRNNNSSRFGKFVELQFDKAGHICGAAIRTYLLERSRVVTVNDPERNYHIFYQLCDGASEKEKQEFFLREAKHFNYLNQSTCYNLHGVDNARDYQRTRQAMSLVGINESDQVSICRTVAAVLHLGNVAFTEGEDADQSIVANETSAWHLEAAAKLLGIDAGALKHSLTTRTRHTRDGPIVSPINVKAAKDMATVNKSIGQDPNAFAVVGVLDIYGFECFKENDFEQFCINLANEKLQQHFNQHVFKMEQAEYEKEQIEWSYITFVDNQDVLDLIEKKPFGIIDLLDETCRFQNATHEDLALKFYTNDEIKKHKRFEKPRRSNTAFTIDHYAGKVTYETDNFLQKNRDYIVAEHQDMLSNSSFEFARALFPPEPVEEPKGKGRGGGGAMKAAFKFSSVGTNFKKQLADLMTSLHTMSPHYIRCIKPNSLNKALLFENAYNLHQLRCGGVLEAIRISCAGYPSKRFYEDFVDHFWMLAPSQFHQGMEEKELSKLIVDNAGLKDYQLGLTKIFLRSGQLAVLDKQRTELLNKSATTVQKNVRRWLLRKQYLRIHKATLVIQAYIRGYFARRLARNMRMFRAALILQKTFRKFKARVMFRKSVWSVIRVQAAWRGFKGRLYAKDIQKQQAATVIQTHFRGFKDRKEFSRVKTAIIVVQSYWRGLIARRELKALRLEAREARKLLEDKRILEAKVNEMQNTLETVQDQRNDLKKQVKDSKAAVAEAMEKLEKAEEEKETLLAAQKANLNRTMWEERQDKDKLENDLKIARFQAKESEAKLKAENTSLSAQIKELLERIAKIEIAQKEAEEEYKKNEEDLKQRLSNAVTQRNEAREASLRLEAELKHQQEEIASGKLIPVTPEVAPPNRPETGIQRRRTSTSIDLSSGRGVRYTKSAMGNALVESSVSSETISAALPVDGIFAGPGEDYPEVDRTQQENYLKQQQILKEQKRQDEEKLLHSLSTHLGFQKGRPLAAVIIFRCCLQWKSFQADKTSIFDKIVQTIGKQIEERQDDNNVLAYWLTNIVTLLYMLQKNIKPASSGTYAKQRTPSARGSFANPSRFANFFSRLTINAPSNASDSSVHGGNAGGLTQVEAKYPALLFKQQLDAFVQRIFPTLRDNIRKEITNHLSACILAPKGMLRTSSSRGGRNPGHGANQPLGRHWGEVLRVLDNLLFVLKANHMPHFLMQMLFKQIFAFINVQLFNQLLLRRECCSFSNGEYVKSGLSEVERWIDQAGRKYVSDSWDDLKFIRQAVSFLVIHQKPNKSLEEIAEDLCPVLSVQQLYRISTMYWDDKYNTETVSPEVLGKMKKLMVDSSSAASHSFLLDDDSSVPFQLEHIVANMDDKELYAEVQHLPDALKQSRGFEFLQQPVSMLN
eukprot:g1097.t1